MSTLAAIGRRTAVLAATVVVGSVLVFLVLAVLPGDAARVALGVNATPEAVAQLRAEFGLDRPLAVQYLDWAGGVLTGDFGTSYVTGADITAEISSRAAVSVWLVALGLVATVVIAVPLGVAAAMTQRTWLGPVLSGISQFGVAVPTFLAGVLLVHLFAVQLGWLPSGGWRVPAEDPVGFLQRVALPVLAIGLVQGALLSRYVRSATLEVLGDDHIRTARATGRTPLGAFLRHGARGAAVPVVTVIGVQVATLLVDAVVVERVFVIPGLGSLLFDAVANRDLLTVQGVVLLLVVTTLVLTWLVDLAILALDPRLRAAAASGSRRAPRIRSAA